MKSAWKIINTDTGRNSQTNDLQQLIDNYNDENVAEHLNNYFVKLPNNLVNELDSIQCQPSGTDFTLFMRQAISKKYPTIVNKPSTIKEIEKIIQSLKPKNSHGYDQIPPRVTKTGCETKETRIV
jgi:hypothetical protein